MKQKLLLFGMLLLALSCMAKNFTSDDYRRNSLCLGYIVEGLKTESEVSLVLESLKKYQISDKFNNHNIGWIVVNPSNIVLTEQDEAVKIKRHKEPFKLSELRGAVSTTNASEIKAEQREHKERFETTPKKLIKYAKENRLANYMVAKWFNPSNDVVDGSIFNMELIKERGAYNASELEKLRAKESVRGMAILKDAGMDLIPNTYLAFVRLKYTSAEEHYNQTADRWDKVGLTAKTEDGKNVNPLSLISGLKRKSAEKQAGYYVDATIYLFKLNWDEVIEEEFIRKYWETSNIESFISNADYKLEYIDCQTSQSRIKANTGINTKDENSLRLISAATYRAIDNGLAKLQKKYSNFAVMAPVIDTDIKFLSAFVGLKEGIAKGDQYDVYEKVYNEEKNIYRYKKVCSVEVDKNRVWDNRYDLDGNYVGRQNQQTEIVLRRDKGDDVTIDTDEDKTKANPDVDRTYFKGNVSNVSPGMLIKQKGK